MKRIALSVLALAVCIGFSGCKSPPKMDSDKSTFDYMQEIVGETTENGGMAAVGIGESRNTQLAITKAKVEARKNLAQLMQVKVENIEKAFMEEIGEASNSELNQSFTATTKQITSQTLQGTAPKMQKYDVDDGITTAYVLMVLNPDVITTALQKNTAEHVYTRFRASQAFDAHEKDIAAYEKYLKEERGVISGQ